MKRLLGGSEIGTVQAGIGVGHGDERSALEGPALKQQLGAEPEFALLFSCLGRGPYFYNGGDQDLALLKTLFPKLPIIGFYGNGEIAPIQGKNEMLQYSAVLALFTDILKT